MTVFAIFYSSVECYFIIWSHSFYYSAAYEQNTNSSPMVQLYIKNLFHLFSFQLPLQETLHQICVLTDKLLTLKMSTNVRRISLHVDETCFIITQLIVNCIYLVKFQFCCFAQIEYLVQSCGIYCSALCRFSICEEVHICTHCNTVYYMLL